tara:strand:+ start:91 stop:270 length:180 start_codon:yes stop_codon:yes gene_type:complete
MNAPIKEWQTEVTGSEEESHGHYILTCSGGGYLQVGETGFIPDSNPYDSYSGYFEKDKS